MNTRPKILIVDDEPFNVDYLEQELEDLDYATISAADGQQALDQVAAEQPDLVLLDIMMPVLDGFAVLARLKADPATRDLPVIIISAMNDLPSVVRGIQQGAEDYLPKPFDPVLLQARLSASLEKKRYRDQEVEYLRQVERLTAAARAIEANQFEAAALAPVAQRPDALGDLARVFQRMAGEVHAREQRLKRQLQQLQLDIEERQKAAAETVAVYIPMDRRQALARGAALPERTRGAALFADISGFTPLTAALARELGFQRGAEELTRQLNRIYAALIAEVHRRGGSVVSFSGDAITCWFDEAAPAADAASAAARAAASALAMQAAMQPFATLTTPAGAAIALAIKVAVAGGPVRRLLVGDPRRQYLDVLAGGLMDELAAAEHLAGRGEVIVSAAVAAELAGRLTIGEHRAGCGVISALAGEVPDCPWPALAGDAVPDAQAEPWLLPTVFEKVRAGKSDLLSELRPAAMLFLRFGGLDYDADEAAGLKLDAFMHWVERVVDQSEGALLQLIVGDKGSYLYIALGVPVAHADDAVRAVRAALELRAPPAALAFITGIQIGITYGQVRAGAYGSPAQRAYGALGDKTNLAARLMMQAAPGDILCDEATYQLAQARIGFEPLLPITVKGLTRPVLVYRPTGEHPATPAVSLTGRAAERALLIDRLSPAEQLALKAASVIGPVFTLPLLSEIYPDPDERVNLAGHLEALEDLDLIVRHASEAEPTYSFKDSLTHATAYNLMLFAQRRQLHRAVAEWHERVHAGDLGPHYGLLAEHWDKAEDPAKAIAYLEKAGEQARQSGAYEEAREYLNRSLALEARASVLSAGYYPTGGSSAAA
ncbi:MAG: response regulator [Anaerolineales bacterium]|nr:response regulator [Anaerolineales bacterium]